jgi:hypothetical protein
LGGYPMLNDLCVLTHEGQRIWTKATAISMTARERLAGT